MDRNVSITINNVDVEVAAQTTILEAARSAGFQIPTLCYHEDLCIAGNCRVCLVDVAGSRVLAAACATPVAAGMKIRTNTAQVRKARQTVIELLLAEHAGECTSCNKSGQCELQRLANEFMTSEPRFVNIAATGSIDLSSPALRKDDGKCIRCQRCVRTCQEVQSVGVFTAAHKGQEMRIETFCDRPLFYVGCTFCGQCVIHCPTGALSEHSYVEEVWAALDDPQRTVVVQTAPAVRAALGEALGMEAGIAVTGKMVTALRRIGFDAVFDTNFTADLTIMEEGHELLRRLSSQATGEPEPLPLITSCSPGWVKFIEHEYPAALDHLSSCKSPQQMFGAVAKTYYAERAGVDPAKLVVVSIMPCTAKKFEANREEMRASGFQDVDFVLTTRELALMIEQSGIDFPGLEDGVCDSLLGEHSGAGVIFGVTGGVMEAALRTVLDTISRQPLPPDAVEILPVRGMAGVREAGFPLANLKDEWNFLAGTTLRVAVAHGLANARALMEKIRSGAANYHFVEIMACPGGCLGGGGQPIPKHRDYLLRRAEAIYAEDRHRPLRKSYENPEIQRIYAEFLGEPLGPQSHRLLHTTYAQRGKV